MEILQFAYSSFAKDNSISEFSNGLNLMSLDYISDEWMDGSGLMPTSLGSRKIAN